MADWPCEPSQGPIASQRNVSCRHRPGQANPAHWHCPLSFRASAKCNATTAAALIDSWDGPQRMRRPMLGRDDYARWRTAPNEANANQVAQRRRGPRARRQKQRKPQKGSSPRWYQSLSHLPRGAPGCWLVTAVLSSWLLVRAAAAAALAFPCPYSHGLRT
ncbi:hypothetical protein BGZ61DRAFT_477715 [Ilyonectria robusta]|uniref:uncharacterized protein n=1 Tax=Ilyonectria robusta TaxID=1079257 RepID=UPI001E8D52BC|nr:uncharacterized protein BGZ61DRAFT_477715 [Ilyonectria robusta]KAH8699744.1 hypothetical protein BGZ61DRAFT_477715 [Ilyonectria robusta]